jgi:hypothetical protein
MSRLIASARFATLVAIGLSLLLVNVAVGAAGSAWILGVANSAGISQTSMSVNTASNGLYLTNAGAGNAVYVVANGGSGVAGITKNGSRKGLVGTNDGVAFVGGAGVEAKGKNNYGLVATSASNRAQAVRAVNISTGVPPDLGAPGRAAGLYGETRNQYGFGVYGLADAAAGGGIGIGVAGVTEALDGYGVYGGSPDGGLGYAGYFDGEVNVNGSITADECFCPIAAAPALNGGSAALTTGIAVTATGAQLDASGRVVLVVEPAQAGDRVVGVVGGALTAGRSADGGTVYRSASGSAAPGAYLRLVTAGTMVLPAAAGLADAPSGAALAIGSGGALAASTGTTSPVGFVIGSLPDGRTVVSIGR